MEDSFSEATCPHAKIVWALENKDHLRLPGFRKSNIMDEILVDGMIIPSSVANIIHLYLLSRVSERVLLRVLDREKIFFFLRYLLSRHLGKVMGIRFVLGVEDGLITILVKKFWTEKNVYVVEGKAVVDPFNSTLTLSFAVRDVHKNTVHYEKCTDEGIYVSDDGGYEIKYCF